MRVWRAITVASAAVALSATTGCAVVPSVQEAEVAESVQLGAQVTTESISVASLRAAVPADWHDVSQTQATEVFPVAYADSAQISSALVRFSPNFHGATNVTDALKLVEEQTETAPATIEGAVSNGMVASQVRYPGAASARTTQRTYQSESGQQMVAHWWMLEDSNSGSIYAVEFSGDHTSENLDLISMIDESIRLGAA